MPNSEYIKTSVDDVPTIEWLSNPNNVAAVINELRDYLPADANDIVVFDHQVYAAVGRIMMERREYSRRSQELRAAGLMDILPVYLEQLGYEAEVSVDDVPSSTGFTHRRIIASRIQPSI